MMFTKRERDSLIIAITAHKQAITDAKPRNHEGLDRLSRDYSASNDAPKRRKD